MSEQKIGSIICPDCGKLISVNAEVCIHCGRKNPGMWGLGPLLRNWMRDYGFTEVVTAVCVAFYVISLLLDIRAIFRLDLFSFLGPSGVSLYKLGATGTIPMAQGRWWTLVTAVYLHGGLLHIFFNLYFLRQIAPQVEELFGTARLIVIFTFAGVLGFVVSNLMGIQFTIGASGALFGLLGALVAYGRARGGSFGEAVYRAGLQNALIMFVFGFLMSGVNNWAHAGGFIGGFLAALVVGFAEQGREGFRVQALTLASIGLTVLCFGMVVWQLFVG
ncbi:rhomboid family intramembrane serine protease [candidate division KSB1 bacterium]|nr:rhomboid family intramembrane serine protease [candidate division KSB1 bacterium]